jgi:hypothetical protein
VNSELGRVWKEAVLAKLEEFLQEFSGEYEENHEICQSGQSVSLVETRIWSQQHQTANFSSNSA